MVTIGLAFVLQGVAAILWKAGTRLPLPVRVEPYIIGDVFISPINVVAAATWRHLPGRLRAVLHQEPDGHCDAPSPTTSRPR